jgi:hypothetical protein
MLRISYSRVLGDIPQVEGRILILNVLANQWEPQPDSIDLTQPIKDHQCIVMVRTLSKGIKVLKPVDSYGHIWGQTQEHSVQVS